MHKDNHTPDNCPLMRRWLPNASAEELREAHANFDAYLGVLYNIFETRERAALEKRLRKRARKEI